MSYGFPDWMFAAIAIAAYELATWVKHRFQFPWAIWIAYGIIVVCAVVLLIRYIIRMVRKRHSGEPEHEDWRDL